RQLVTTQPIEVARTVNRLEQRHTFSLRATGRAGPVSTAGRRDRARAAPRSDTARITAPSNKTAQHVLQDAAVAVVVRLTGGVDAHDRVELDRLLALGRELARLGGDAHRLRCDTVVERLEARDRHDLGSVEAERLPALPLGELQGDDTHPDEVGAVDALEALGDDRLDAQQRGAPGRPVPRRARAVLLAAEHDERDARRLVVHARVVDEGLRAARLSEVAGVPALDHLTV